MSTHCKECGAVQDEKSRSLPDLRRFHALLEAAFHQWPHSESFQPSCKEQLRAYLLIKAGWTDVEKVAIPPRYAESPDERAAFRDGAEGASRAARGPSGYFEMRIRDDALEVITARTISRRTGQREFNRVRETVEAQLEDIIGVPADQLLREKAA